MNKHPTRQDFRLLHRLRVRWAEVDMQNIVFNAHYLMYMDVAITEYWRDSAMPFAQSFGLLGGDMVVRKATVDFIQSARMDDVLDIGMRFVQAGRSSMLFQGAVFRGHELLATGELTYVYTTPDHHAKTSQPVPQALRDALAAYEAGEPMTQLHLLPWSACQAQAMPLRHAVFAQEKGIPPELMGDEADATAVHVLVTNHLGLALATGRMVLPASLSAPSGSAAPTPGQQAEQARRTGQVGRMAVLHAQRSQGLGARMLHALLQQARELGLDDVVLHAQLGAVDFYARHGFECQGEVFEAAGLPHQTMVLNLAADTGAGHGH